MSDAQRRDEMLELADRLARIEQRLASLEQWTGAPTSQRTPPPPERRDEPPRIESPALSEPIPPPPVRSAMEIALLPSAPARVPVPVETAAPLRPLSPPEARQAVDFEAMIGRHWASWAGGIVLILGICFFLKYAWDQGWIRPSPQMRVLLAVALGLVVCALGEWVWRMRMRPLAAALHGTGVAILFASFFGANRYFEPPVLSLTSAFSGVGVAAAIGIFLALRVNVMSVAILAMIGAYLSPAILSSGKDKSLELLSYLAVLAAVGWALSFLKGTRTRADRTRLHWTALRWVVLVGGSIWFFVWWEHFGQDNNHHTLALAWLAVIYCGFLAESFLTLQVALPRMPAADVQVPLLRFQNTLTGPMGRARADATIALFALVNTAVTFASLYMVLEREPQRVVALIAIVLAVMQGVVAMLTVSRALMWSALLAAAGLVTLAVPLWLDDFSITIAWLLLAAGLAALAWQFNLPAARAWGVALLFLATARLVVIDASSPSMRGVVITIAQQPVPRWMLLGWCIAVLFHLVAWMKPQAGQWPAADRWINQNDAAKLTLVGNETRRRSVVLDYAAPAEVERDVVEQPDPAGILLAAVGTILFGLASASQWHDAPLTLLGIIWLAPIVLLAPLATRLGYATHGILLIAVIAMHWLMVDNVNPLLEAWKRPERDLTRPILNLPALNGLLICAAIAVLVLQPRQPRRLNFNANETALGACAIILFAALTFECWRAVDAIANRGVAMSDVTIVKHVTMSVLWSVIGFACVLIGFWKRLITLRIAALCLLGITLAKVFIVDMKDVKAVWRILSFMALGSLLLGVSYLYHRALFAPPARNPEN